MSQNTGGGPLPLSLFLLRVSLGGFLLVWAIDKLVRPESTVKIFHVFYAMGISTNIALGLGVLQVILCLAFILGVFKTITYGVALAIHAVSTLSTYNHLLHPYTGNNHLFLAAIPVLAAFVVLFLMRQEDTFLSLGTQHRQD